MSESFVPSNMPSPLVFERVSREQFEQELQPMGQPFVMKGFAKHWHIVKSGLNSPNDLRKNALQLNEAISVTRILAEEKSRMFYNPDMTGMNFGVASLSLDDCLRRMQETADNGKDDSPDYAAQCVPVAKYFPQILNNIDNPLVEKGLEPFIWFGNRVIVAPHFDETDNIAVVAAGRRRFTLFPPQQTKNLYIGPLDFNPAGQAISLVNILKPDLDAHPKYAEAYKHGLSVELAPGDAIYIPTPWWHHVQSLSPFNVLINYWWSQNDFGTAKPLGALLHAIQAFRTLPKPQQEAFKALLDYYVFDEPNASREHIPEHAHGWLGELDDEKRRVLEHWIKNFSQ